jgi:membrane-bound ClpP family serine protease
MKYRESVKDRMAHVLESPAVSGLLMLIGLGLIAIGFNFLLQRL